MFRKSLTILALGIAVLGFGAVKSNAQCEFRWTAQVYAPPGTDHNSYTMWDWQGVSCALHPSLSWKNSKTGDSGVANENSISSAAVATSGASFSGTMLVNNKTYMAFTMTLDATARTIAFTLKDPKTGRATVSTVSALDPSSTIYLNP